MNLLIMILNTLLNDKPGYSGTGLKNSTVLRIAGSGPANGTVSVNTTTGAITYTPNSGFIGTDTYKYVVCDSLNRCDTATQQITILPPTSPNLTQATDDYNTITQGGTATGNVLLNDQDPQKNTQSVTPKVDTIPGVGILTLGANGNYTFVPVPGFNGPVNVPYEVCDNGTPVACAQATLYILVNPFDTDPDIHATFVGLPISGDVGTNDKVLGGTTYGTATAIAGNPSNSLPTVSADGTYTFTSNVPGTYQFNVPVCKPGQTSGCELELLTINVLDPNSSNNAPIANTDIANTLMNAPVSIPTVTNDQASNGGAILDPASIQVITQPTSGSVSVNPSTGVITYTPNTGFTGVDTYKYLIQQCRKSPLFHLMLQIRRRLLTIMVFLLLECQ